MFVCFNPAFGCQTSIDLHMCTYLCAFDETLEPTKCKWTVPSESRTRLNWQ